MGGEGREEGGGGGGLCDGLASSTLDCDPPHRCLQLKCNHTLVLKHSAIDISGGEGSLPGPRSGTN